MFMEIFLRTLIIIFLFCNLINLNYASYIEYSLSFDSLCSEVINKRKLSFHNNDAIKVYNTRTFDNWLGYKIFSCKFKLRASQNQGIYAVFQEFSFRKDSNGQCLDYVLLKENHKKKTRKYCGNGSLLSLEEENHITNDDDDLLNYSFRDYHGDMDVVIYVANKKVESYENLELKMVFTPFRKNEDQDYRECVSGESIKLEYFYDGIVNCPYVGCKDENTCSISPPPKGERNTLKITAGAIGTVFLAFLLFFICLYNIKRYKVLCWAEDPRLNNTNSTRTTSCPDEDGEETRAHLNALHLTTTSSPSPSAPSLPQEDKDLPPTYDSLFPNR